MSVQNPKSFSLNIKKQSLQATTQGFSLAYKPQAKECSGYSSGKELQQLDIGPL
jgi:hypothetical protein